MPKARKLPSGNYRTLVYDFTDEKGKRHYKSFTASTKKEAEYLAAKFSISKKSTVNQEYSDLTLEEAILRYCETKSNILSPSTIMGYKAMLRTSYETIKAFQLEQINQEVIQIWANEYSLSHSPKTVRNAHGLLSSVFSVYKPDFALRTTLPKKCKYKAYVPNDKEVEILMRTHKANDNGMLIASCLSAFGTLRRSELCALTIDDVQGNSIHVCKAMVMTEHRNFVVKDMTKNISSNRIIELPEFIIKMFPNSGNIVPYTPAQITLHHYRALTKIDIPYFRFHDLRHYAASIMHALGIPDQYIMQTGGWSSDTTLKNIYRGTIDDYSKKFRDVSFQHFESMQHEIQHEK
jgi:integrase